MVSCTQTSLPIFETKTLKIYTDAAWITDRAASVFLLAAKNRYIYAQYTLRRSLKGSIESELYAISDAVNFIIQNKNSFPNLSYIHIYTDSKEALRQIQENYKKYKLYYLTHDILAKTSVYHTTFNYIKGHSYTTNPNKYVDILARKLLKMEELWDDNTDMHITSSSNCSGFVLFNTFNSA